MIFFKETGVNTLLINLEQVEYKIYNKVAFFPHTKYVVITWTWITTLLKLKNKIILC